MILFTEPSLGVRHTGGGGGVRAWRSDWASGLAFVCSCVNGSNDSDHRIVGTVKADDAAFPTDAGDAYTCRAHQMCQLPLLII